MQESIADFNNFNTWFGNSVTKFGSALPNTFYHKSRSKVSFDEFKHFGEEVIKNQYNKDYGFYFVLEEHKHHITYIGNGLDIFVYLKMENPFIIRDTLDGNIIDQEGKKYDALIMSEDFCKSILEKGFDSIIIECKKVYDQFVVFHPNQIKSVLNHGEFSLESNNMFK